MKSEISKGTGKLMRVVNQVSFNFPILPPISHFILKGRYVCVKKYKVAKSEFGIFYSIPGIKVVGALNFEGKQVENFKLSV